MFHQNNRQQDSRSHTDPPGHDHTGGQGNPLPEQADKAKQKYSSMDLQETARFIIHVVTITEVVHDRKPSYSRKLHIGHSF